MGNQEIAADRAAGLPARLLLLLLFNLPLLTAVHGQKLPELQDWNGQVWQGDDRIAALDADLQSGSLGRFRKLTEESSSDGEATAPLEPGENENVESEKVESDGNEEEAEKHEGVRRTSDAEWTMVLMMGLFLTSLTGLLYLTNYPDADVRHEVFVLLSVTVSIFIAILMTQALWSFIFDQIVQGEPPRGFGVEEVPPLLTASVGFILFAMTLVFLSWVQWKVVHTKDPRREFCTRYICSHFLAFMGREVFGTLQEELSQRNMYVLVPSMIVAACIILVAMIAVSLRTRYQKVMKMKDSGESTWEQRSTWMDKCEGAEDEANVIIVSFLFHQYLVLLVCGHLPAMEGEEDIVMYSGSERLYFALVTLIILIILCAVVVIAGHEHHTKRGVRKNPAEANQDGEDSTLVQHNADGAKSRAQSGVDYWELCRRVPHNVDHFLAMLLGWNMFRLCLWQMMAWLSCWGEHWVMMAAVFNAFFASTIALICVILLDCIADKLAADETDETKSEADEKAGVANPKEQAVRTVIKALGLVVGLGWEAAFDNTAVTVVEGSPALNRHPVIFKIVSLVIMSVWIFPAFYMYIAPKAIKDREQHEQDIKDEKARNGNPAPDDENS